MGQYILVWLRVLDKTASSLSVFKRTLNHHHHHHRIVIIQIGPGAVNAVFSDLTASVVGKMQRLSCLGVEPFTSCFFFRPCKCKRVQPTFNSKSTIIVLLL